MADEEIVEAEATPEVLEDEGEVVEEGEEA